MPQNEDEGLGGPSSMEFVGGADTTSGDNTLFGTPFKGRNYTAPRSTVDKPCCESVQEMARKLKEFFSEVDY